MKILKIIPLIILAAYLFSCEKVLEVNVGELPPKIVVDGTINIGEPPQVILRHSGFLYDSIDIEKEYIHNAIVEVSDGSTTVTLQEICFSIYSKLDSVLGDNDTLSQNELIQILVFLDTQEEMDSVYTYYYGISPEELEKSFYVCAYVGVPLGPGFPYIVGEEGKTYTLSVKSGDEHVTAKTTIPFKFDIDSLTVKPNSEYPNYSEVFIHLTFPPNLVLGNYIQYGSKTTGTAFYYGMRTGSVYSDATFEGSTSLSLPLEGRKYDDEGRPASAERQFVSGDTVTLIWKNIDKTTYEYIFSSENNGGSSPFSSPTKVLSNIEGGLGVWAGYNVSYSSIYIP